MGGHSTALGQTLEILLAGGGGAALLGIVNTIVKRYFSKNKEQVNAAKVIQAMSLDMIRPLHDELDRLHRQTAELSEEFDQLLKWARAANRELSAHGLSVGPMPLFLARNHQF